MGLLNNILNKIIPGSLPATPQERFVEEEKKEVQRILKLYEEVRGSKEIRAKTWLYILSHLSGNPLRVNFLEGTGRAGVEGARVYEYQVPLILSHWIRINSILDDGKIRWECIPASSDRDDVDIAKHSEVVLRNIADDDNIGLREEMSQWRGWAFACGTSFMHVYWDSKAKSIGVEASSPMEIDWDLRVIRFEKSRWCMRTYKVGRLWLEENYPEAAKQIGEKDESVEGGRSDKVEFWRERIDLMSSILGVEQNAPEGHRGILIHEYWERPTEKYPKGRCIIISHSGKVIYNDINPYWFYGLPFVPLYEYRRPGQRYGSTRLEPLSLLNEQYNKARSQQVEHQDLVSHPIRYIAKGMGITEADINKGEVKNIFYNPQPGTPPPHTEFPPPMSGAQIANQMAIREDFMEISGLRDASRGINPPQVRSAAQLAMLKESDMGALTSAVNNISFALKKLGRLILLVYAHYSTEEKRIAMPDRSGLVTDFVISGGDLYKVGEDGVIGKGYFNVKVDKSSLFPRSKLAVRRELEWLLQMGLLNIQQDRQKILDALEEDSVQEFFDTERGEKQIANFENYLMERGIDVFPESYNDDILHIREHQRRMKQPDFFFLSPEVKMKFTEHVAAHQLAYANKSQMVSSLMGTGAQSVVGEGKQPLVKTDFQPFLRPAFSGEEGVPEGVIPESQSVPEMEHEESGGQSYEFSPS